MTVLCSVWDPEHQHAVLCVETEGGDLAPVGTEPDPPGDVAGLLALWPSAPSLDDALDRCGVAARPRWHAGQLAPNPSPGRAHLRAPVAAPEVWAAGVTYEHSREARMSESGDSDVYARIYDAVRPELFLKATGARVVGPGGEVGLRDDSVWQVPEPELALVLGGAAQVLGFTLANDMSCRDIEGENPLYLPQAKVFSGSVSIGPRVITPDEIPNPYALEIGLDVRRGGRTVFAAACSTSSLRRSFEELVDALGRSNPLPPGVTLLTGTGVVPDDDLALAPGDVVRVWCDSVGTLENVCADAAAMAAPAGWSTPIPGGGR